MKAQKVMATIDAQGQLTLDTPLSAIKNSRVGVIILIPEEDETNESTQAELLGDFKQAWHEAMTGQTIPVEQLWDDIDQTKNHKP